MAWATGSWDPGAWADSAWAEAGNSVWADSWADSWADGVWADMPDASTLPPMGGAGYENHPKKQGGVIYGFWESGFAPRPKTFARKLSSFELWKRRRKR